jgi:hypothetical protein
MRTQNEILERITELKSEDYFGFQRSDLTDFLKYENAKSFLKEDVTKQEWDKNKKILSKEVVLKEIREYMPFAWNKANNNRGLSADRSINHMLAWTWLMNDGFYDKLKKSYLNNYKYYGKPQLVLICEHYGLDWTSLDDDRWTSYEDGDGITANEALGRN